MLGCCVGTPNRQRVCSPFKQETDVEYINLAVQQGCYSFVVDLTVSCNIHLLKNHNEVC